MASKRLRGLVILFFITGLLLFMILPLAKIGAQGSVASHFSDFGNGTKTYMQGQAQSLSNGRDTNLNGLSIYTNRVVFDGDFPSLQVEDFEGNILAPNNVLACPPPLNINTNDSCFPEGGVKSGIELDVGLNGGTGLYVLLTQGFLGVTSDVVGPNTFVDLSIWRFDPPATAVGMDFVWPLGAGNVNIEIRDGNGAVIGNNVQNAPSFWGVYSTIPIGEIRIDDGGVGDLYDNLAFGVPGIALSKKPSSQDVAYGGNANFTITVTNTGNVDLNNVSVSDPLVSNCNNVIGTLPFSTTHTYNCADIGVSTSYTNVVNITSTFGISIGPSDTATATVNILPHIFLPSIFKVDSAPSQNSVGILPSLGGILIGSVGLGLLPLWQKRK